ncbi:PAS domain-containing sensor histidine kinase [Histidinibacterium lentulum]|uniref:histidine kinase n=1 Tax=Histidinibacterium lentulum TaxID=2480588 RepID=A0A3N2QYB0_9RHOB|nr:HWE histidine kinase domain-containing protein [Histidinibacterium lentulum]ROU00098.1 GAF domain-containing protein [Histidinibacterium lentulum]
MLTTMRDWMPQSSRASGEMADLMHETDWLATPLGPREAWPPVLVMATQLMLATPNPAFVLFGTQDAVLYNEGYRFFLGDRHPAALGQPLRNVWPELMDRLEPRLLAIREGEPQIFEEQEFHIGPEDAGRWFIGHWVPLRDETGEVVGIFGEAQETTGRVEAERARACAEAALREREGRLSFLFDLTEALRPLHDPVEIEFEACRRLAEWLDVDRAYYVEIDEKAGLARVNRDFARGDSQSIVGCHQLADFTWSLELLRTGDPTAIMDVRTSPLVPPGDLHTCEALQIIACVGTPLIKRGVVVGSLNVTHPEPRAWTEQETLALQQVSELIWATTERARAETATRASEEKYRRLFETMDEGHLLAEVIRDDRGNVVDMLYTEANPAARAMVKANFTGRRLSDVGDGFEPHWWEMPAMALDTGEPQRAELYAEPLGQWFNVGVTKAGSDRVSILFRDITARKEHEAERELLLGELNHRVKNMLAVVMSISSQTMRTAPDMGAFASAFTNRVQSLARAHALLSTRHWKDADLSEVVNDALSPFAGPTLERVTADGPGVRLKPNTVLTLSLALHELGTNAAKYGALSVAKGRVRVCWSLDETGRIGLDWTESGGPTVRQPRRKGFGSRLLTKGVARELDGEVTLDYRPEGLACRIEFAPGVQS